MCLHRVLVALVFPLPTVVRDHFFLDSISPTKPRKQYLNKLEFLNTCVFSILNMLNFISFSFLLSSFFFFFFSFLFFLQRENERTLPLMGFFPNAHNGWDWVGLKSRARNQEPRAHSRPPTWLFELWPQLAEVCFIRKLETEAIPGSKLVTVVWYTNILTSVLNDQTSAPMFNFQYIKDSILCLWDGNK